MADLHEDVFFAPILDLNRRLKAREFSASELTSAFLDRLEKLGPRYNALVLLLRDQALRDAKDVDGDLKRSRFRGPLQGIPYGAKDLFSVAGRPTAWGAPPYAGQVFSYTATALKKLEKSAAVLIGKLAMIELAGGGGYRFPAASVSGACANPWNRDRWAGGSSSGSAAAVAAGLVPFALGSETWGSILTPSAYCGVTGLRPTYGYVSRYGAMALSWTMDKIGPLARSAEDCGLILQAISGADSEDPSCAGKSFYYAPQFARKLSEIHVGFAPADFDTWAEPSTREAFQKAMQVIRDLGMPVRETTLPDFPYSLVASTIIAAEGSSVFEPLVRSGRVDQLADQRQIAGLRTGLDIPARDYLKAMRLRGQIQQAMRKLLTDIDVLVSPARFGPAPRITDPIDRRPDRERSLARTHSLRDLNAAGNLAGLPALSLPCGFVGGLPVGLQLVGRAFSENTLLAIGREFQLRTDWHKRRPPV
jgi:aspartyl-tRNA(Asn)/glutamyl-tRNA(Gln) amidotransferase subunit A